MPRAKYRLIKDLSREELESLDKILGSQPDRKVAGIYNVDSTAIVKRRRKLKISPYRNRGESHSWTNEEHQLLGTLNDIQLAEIIKVPINQVQRERKRLGIKSYSRSISQYKNLLKKAKVLAADKHKRQDYGSNDYLYHLLEVFNILEEHKLSMLDVHQAPVLIASILHDILSDTNVSKEYLLHSFGPRIFDIVAAVTDEPGESRKDRWAKTAPKIRTNLDAINLKIADRIANLKFSTNTKCKKLKMYVKEHPNFVGELYSEDCDSVTKSLWDTLDSTYLKATQALEESNQNVQ